MKQVTLFLVALLFVCLAIHAQEDIFKKHGVTKEPLTLSKGKYKETFYNEKIMQIGTVLINTETEKVIRFLDEDSTKYAYKAETTSRFLTVDPLAEKYYSWSPYVYVGNNPIIRTDPTGMDWYFFDEDKEGEYSHKKEQDGKHRMVMRSKDKEGNIKFTFYDFADPENDPSDIENGTIDRAELVNESDVRGIMEGQGGFDMSNSSIRNFMNKSVGGKNFDYSSGGALRNYMASKGRGNKFTTSLYIPVGDTYAHNFMNFGNFLWGATGYTLGYSQNMLLKAADLNSRFDPGRGNGYPGEPDSPDDQLSITRGTEYARKNLYRYRTNPSWLGKLLNIFR